MIAVFGELSPPTSLTAAVTSSVAGASFMRTMFRALEMCLPLFILMVAIFRWPQLVVEPGLPQVLPAAMILVVTVGITASLHGRFSDTLIVQRASKIAIGVLSVVLLFQPPLAITAAAASGIVALAGFGWFRTRQQARAVTAT